MGSSTWSVLTNKAVMVVYQIDPVLSRFKLNEIKSFFLGRAIPVMAYCVTHTS